MTDKKILKMLKEIVEYIDYDIYKEIFVYGGVDEDAETIQKHLLEIVKKYIPIKKKRAKKTKGYPNWEF